MTSKKQVEANRRNALLSSGPKSTVAHGCPPAASTIARMPALTGRERVG